jgi:hypothetical protein
VTWDEFLASQGSPAAGTLAYAQARFDYTDDGSLLEEEDL